MCMQGTWLRALRSLNLRDQRENPPPPKVPSWHLTGDKAMEYITAVNDRQETKRQENEKYETAKKEAVKKG